MVFDGSVFKAYFKSILQLRLGKNDKYCIFISTMFCKVLKM